MPRGGWNKGKKTGPLSEECKYKLSESLKGREITIQHRERIGAALKGKPKSEAHRQNMCKARRRFFDSEEGKQAAKRHGERFKGRPSSRKGVPRSEAEKARMQEGHARRSPEEKSLWREKLSLAAIGRSAWNKGLTKDTDERVAKWAGENSPFWKGGITPKPYGPGFNEELKRAIRRRDDRTCQLCSSGGRSVHHIDYDKENNEPLNLITLCKSCHGRTHTSRESWDFYFSALQLERFVLPMFL